MPERFEGLLPVGSVVRLQGSDAQVMVLGFEPQLGDVRADYLGVAYPMGLVSDDAALAFDAMEEEPEPDFPDEDELGWLPDEVRELVDGPAEH